MPIVFRDGGLACYLGFQLGLAARDPVRPRLKGGGKDAKIWLEPEVALADSYGFNSAELARILRIVSAAPGPDSEGMA